MTVRGGERGKVLIHRVVAMYESPQRDGVPLPPPRVSELFDRAALNGSNEIRAK